MKFDLKKFILGFLPVDGEHLGKVLNIVVWLVIGGVIIWKLFIQPTNRQVQNLENAFAGAHIDQVTIEQINEDTKKKWWQGIDPYFGYHIKAEDYEVGISLDW